MTRCEYCTSRQLDSAEVCARCGAPLAVGYSTEEATPFAMLDGAAALGYRLPPLDYSADFPPRFTRQSYAEQRAERWNSWTFEFPRVGILRYIALTADVPIVCKLRMIENGSWVLIDTPRLPLPLSFPISPVQLQTLAHSVRLEISWSIETLATFTLRYDISEILVVEPWTFRGQQTRKSSLLEMR